MSKKVGRLRRGAVWARVVAVPLLAVGQAVAGEPSTAAPSASDSQRVDIQGSAQQARSAAVGAMVLVPREELLRHGDTRLADALRRVPGLTVVSSGANGSEIRMAGLGGGYTQVLINGEPLPSGFQIDSLSPALIERVEISRSTGAAQGAQGVAGSLNIVLRRADRTGQREAKLAVGSQKGEPLVESQMQWRDRGGDLAWGVSAGLASLPEVWRSSLLQQSRGAAGLVTQAYGTDWLNQVRTDSLNLSPQATWTLAPDHTLSLDNLLRIAQTRNQDHFQRSTLAGEPPPITRNDVHNSADQQQLRSSLNWARQQEDGNQASLKLGLNLNHRSTAGNMQGYDQADAWVLDRSVASATQGQGLSLSGRWRTPWHEAHAFSTGWDSEWQRRSDSRLQHDAPLPASQLPLNLDENYQARVSRLASFVQDEWTLNPAWTATLGLRWEGLLTQSQGNTFNAVSSRSSVFSPVLQVMWQVPDSKDQVRAALARTYKAPTPQELMPRRFYAYVNSATTPDTEGNPNLRPELAWGLDLGWDHPLGKASQISLSVYLKRIAGVVLDQLFTRPDALGVDQWVLQRVNLGQAWAQGAELELRASLREFWLTAPAINLHTNLGVNQSRVQAVPGPNNRLAEQTPWTLNLGLDHSTDTPGLSWGASWNQQAGANLRLSALRLTDKAPQRTLDAYALWRQSPTVQWRLSLSNALHGDIAETRQVLDQAGNGYLMDERFHSASTLRLEAEIKL